MHGQPARARPGGDRDARARRDGRFARGIAIGSGADTGDARIAAEDGLLQLQRELDLALGREARELGTVEIQLGGHDAVGLREAVPFVDLAELCVVPRVRERFGDRALVEGAGVSEADPLVDDHPHADPGGLRRGERLDLALVGAHRQPRGSSDVGLDLLSRLRLLRHTAGDVEQLAHRPLMPRCRRS